MIELVQALQVVSSLTWLMVATFIVTPFLFKRLRNIRVEWTTNPDLLVMMGLTQAGFSLRWMVWPHALPSMGWDELSAWAILYTVSTYVGAKVIYLTYRNQKPDHE